MPTVTDNRDNIKDTKYEVLNKSSFNINFRFVDAITGAAVAPSDVKVYIYVEGTGTIVNSRDGTNDTGLTTTDTNLVNFNLSPADLTIVETAARGNEIHRVIFEVQYNAGADKYIREYIITIINSLVSVT